MGEGRGMKGVGLVGSCRSMRQVMTSAFIILLRVDVRITEASEPGREGEGGEGLHVRLIG